MYRYDDIGHGALILLKNYTFALVWAKSSYFLFDSHGHNGEGILAEKGNSVLLKFQSTKQIQMCIQDVFLNNNERGSFSYDRFNTLRRRCRNCS